MLCPAIKDPFEGPNYRLAAVIHQGILCPLLCKLTCLIFEPSKKSDTSRNKLSNAHNLNHLHHTNNTTSSNNAKSNIVNPLHPLTIHNNTTSTNGHHNTNLVNSFSSSSSSSISSMETAEMAFQDDIIDKQQHNNCTSDVLVKSGKID